MIPSSLSVALLCVLNIWTIKCASGCGDRQRMLDGGICCNLCPPGEFVVEFCSQHQQTKCRPCEEGSYSHQHSLFGKCEECRSCQQEYAEKCTPTANAKCQCRSGFLCSNNVCSICEENKCVTGEKPKRTEKPVGQDLIEYSYQCEPICRDNEYYDAKNNACKARIQCSIFGFEELFPGNKSHNAVCERAESGWDFIHVILGVGFVLLSLTLLVLLSYACIKKARKPKQYNNPIDAVAMSVSTNDFHLSKEESGPHLIIQDEYKSTETFETLLLEKVAAF